MIQLFILIGIITYFIICFILYLITLGKPILNRKLYWFEKLGFKYTKFKSTVIKQSILFDIYYKIYKNSTPVNNFYKMLKTGEAKEKSFFDNYFIPIEKMEKIISKKLKFYNITKKKDIDDYKFELYLGGTPTNNKKVYYEKRFGNNKSK